jgi:hypothetical protein
LYKPQNTKPYRMISDFFFGTGGLKGRSCATPLLFVFICSSFRLILDVGEVVRMIQNC